MLGREGNSDISQNVQLILSLWMIRRFTLCLEDENDIKRFHVRIPRGWMSASVLGKCNDVIYVFRSVLEPPGFSTDAPSSRAPLVLKLQLLMLREAYHV